MVATALLLLSGVATATYLGVRTWVSSSPRGAQVTSDFRLSRVVRLSSSGGWVWGTALSADGHDLFLSRGPGNANGWEILRVRGVDSPHPSAPRRVLDLGAVADPAFRDSPAWQGLAAGPDGNLFVLGGGRGGSRPAVASVLVVHPDGSRQTVVTYRELRRRGVVPGMVRDPTGCDHAPLPRHRSRSPCLRRIAPGCSHAWRATRSRRRAPLRMTFAAICSR